MVWLRDSFYVAGAHHSHLLLSFPGPIFHFFFAIIFLVMIHLVLVIIRSCIVRIIDANLGLLYQCLISKIDLGVIYEVSQAKKDRIPGFCECCQNDAPFSNGKYGMRIRGPKLMDTTMLL